MEKIKPDFFYVYCIENIFVFEKNNIYKCTYMSYDNYDDPLDPLLYNVYHKDKNISMPYRTSQKYFISLQELRKLKLQKLKSL